MRKCFIGALILFFTVLPQSVLAVERVYIKGTVGVFMLEDFDNSFEHAGGDHDTGTTTSDTGVSRGIAIGKSLSNGFDMELEFARRIADLDEFQGNTYEEVFGTVIGEVDDLDRQDATLEIKTLMFNGIYNFKNTSSFTPYLGAGFGIAWVDTFETDTDVEESALAYQFMAGVGKKITERLTFLVGYRYIGMEEVEYDETKYHWDDVNLANIFTEGEGSFSLASHNVDFSLKYTF